ncbi:hypothetical protein TeGR_g14070 [Tetraparma gracilis]|uniref:Uncharacterized protein n=1 Tax=Tetraparma gracilis TaxID=2962635 RepID=A0ABQ6MMF7_9STRA|nr:hypothetical protein TeGR_g14070 [Tetraparma gracilis]
MSEYEKQTQIGIAFGNLMQMASGLKAALLHQRTYQTVIGAVPVGTPNAVQQQYNGRCDDGPQQTLASMPATATTTTAADNSLYGSSNNGMAAPGSPGPIGTLSNPGSPRKMRSESMALDPDIWLNNKWDIGDGEGNDQLFDFLKDF